VIVMTGRDLLTTAQAARLLGVSTRTLVRYAEKGYVTPEMVLPSGHRRWILEDVRRQIRDLSRQRDE
jgi:excisionase family DNA binding protein